MSRLHDLLEKLGTTGVLGLGVLLFCVPFYFSALAPAEQELKARQDGVNRPQARGSLRTASSDNRTEELRRFYEQFPQVEELPKELDHVYALAREAKLELMQGDYQLEVRPAGLVAYRIALPVRGAYSQVRSFIALVLKEIPIASVDGLRFERKRAVETQVEAQVRLTLHFRPENRELR